MIVYENKNLKAGEIKRVKVVKVLTHGGKRKGAGRKPKEPTVTKRIPIGILDKVEALIKKHKAKPFHG